MHRNEFYAQDGVQNSVSAANGFTESLLLITGFQGLQVPCYPQVNHRVKELDNQPIPIKATGSIAIAIDSTGVKVFE